MPEELKYKNIAFCVFSSFAPGSIPWGAVSIANYLKSKGFENTSIHCIESYNDIFSILNEFKRNKPDLICFSAMTIEISLVFEALKIFKENLKNVNYNFGGVLFSSDPDCIKSEGTVTVGSGEEITWEIITGKKSSEKGNVYTGKALENYDYNPMPYEYHLKQFAKKIFYDEAKLITSRGCPFQCKFCLDPGLRETKMTYYNLDYVEKYMISVNKILNIRKFHILDDIFFLNKKRVFVFCDRVDALGFRPRFRAFSHAKIKDFELYKRISKSGFSRIDIGIESADNEVLESIGKKIKIEEVEETISMIREAGLQPHCLFMIGHPRDTKETVKKTVFFAEKMNLNYGASSWFSFAQPFPGTEFRREAEISGTLVYTDFSKYNNQNVCYIPENLDEDFIREWREKGMYLGNKFVEKVK